MIRSSFAALKPSVGTIEEILRRNQYVRLSHRIQVTSLAFAVNTGGTRVAQVGNFRMTDIQQMLAQLTTSKVMIVRDRELVIFNSLIIYGHDRDTLLLELATMPGSDIPGTNDDAIHPSFTHGFD